MAGAIGVGRQQKIILGGGAKGIGDGADCSYTTEQDQSEERLKIWFIDRVVLLHGQQHKAGSGGAATTKAGSELLLLLGGGEWTNGEQRFGAIRSPTIIPPTSA